MLMQQLPGSKNILRAGHDSATGILRIEFRSGGVYDYTEVPSAEYEALVAAHSPGSYFHSNIRGKFKHTRLEHDADAAA
jgi:hypothetical protein